MKTLIPFLYLCFYLSYSGTAESQPSGNSKPNILFIMADDHTKQAIGCYGSRLSKLNPTPTIDRLASQGIQFDNVFCSNAICTPSRASIITGQYSQTNGVLDLNGSIGPDKQFLPKEMKKAGYETAMIGKWHLKKEPATFDYYCVLPGQGLYHNPIFNIRGSKPWPKNTITKKDQHSSDAITDISLHWLKNERDKSKPFFLMHHFKAPHDMFEYAKRYESYLEDVHIPEPESLFSVPAGSAGSKDLGSGLSKNHNPWQLPQKLGVSDDIPEPEYTRLSYQKYLKAYLRCVKGIDDNIARLLSYLKDSNQLDNTIIIYTSDQGFFLGEHNLIDKRWMYEEAMGMPFIVYAPGMIKNNFKNNCLINNTDFAPTLLEIAGLKKTPNYMQGKSFYKALSNQQKPDEWRTVTYYRYWMHMAHKLAVPAHFGIRSESHKLIFFYGRKYGRRGGKPTPISWEFYDLDKDPKEMKNEYKNPEYKEIIKRLKTQLLEIRKDLNEEDKKYPEIQKIIENNWDQILD
ncbi:mucin-desulfating sulfatase (N-acetylglucosamine-6-sulfatase) [Lentisphaera araneosa HTCC2155]|uniref:Mucin-desulfating sulfatase (N-acetylglucosamine-6-sulfatase) n=1 Tax=Lentisphaera araneosa HTCC2155 TaxID=313628 RepID=A6DG71_9BACT|nr:sulfatase [Lentisphaera araneosa]EDM29188.1 mucin-desulfating sulfatase (N-acetylglucosamine-6-sulfatase) [Lentisphaera araneosa HTCC2155]